MYVSVLCRELQRDRNHFSCNGGRADRRDGVSWVCSTVFTHYGSRDVCVKCDRIRCKKAEVRGEIQSLEPNTEPKHLLKDPYILEFLGLEENKTYLEHELEQGLIDNLQNFLLELGKGFCFVARQKELL